MLIPHVHELRHNALRQCAHYWSLAAEPIAALPMPAATSFPPEQFPVRLVMVELPAFATNVGVHGALAVPIQLCPPSKHWAEVDWLLVMNWFLHNLAEREHEQRHGSVHSYSFRLQNWDHRMWEHAWVNRTALFLRRWAARHSGVSEDYLLGPLPQAHIELTHDVDALRKTLPIRLKQAAFHAFNAVRALRHGKIRRALARCGEALRFFATPGDDWSFERIARLDETHGLSATFFFAGLAAPAWHQNFRQWLIDPHYDAATMRPRITSLQQAGHRIGLHPSCTSWNDAASLRKAAQDLEKAATSSITRCRQHWLMFSFAHTWHAQQAAGLREDYTLGFNDRPGFRNGAALSFTPLKADDTFVCKPLIMMDSHFHDYAMSADADPLETMHTLVKEVHAVKGQATVLWHPHTISMDYGWTNTYLALLHCLTHESHSTLRDIHAP